MEFLGLIGIALMWNKFGAIEKFEVTNKMHGLPQQQQQQQQESSIDCANIC